MLVVQLIFTVIGLSILGVYIGLRIDEDGTMPTILGATGFFCDRRKCLYGHPIHEE